MFARLLGSLSRKPTTNVTYEVFLPQNTEINSNKVTYASNNQVQKHCNRFS